MGRKRPDFGGLFAAAVAGQKLRAVVDPHLNDANDAALQALDLRRVARITDKAFLIA